MALLFVIVLTLATGNYVLLTFLPGAKSDRGCDDIESECSAETSFQQQVDRAYQETTDTLLTNEFFRENCNSMLEYWECLQDFSLMCRTDLMLDLNILINYTAEFCDEESDLRKAYVDHFACLNRMNLTTQVCFVAAQKKMVELVPEIIELLKTTSLKTNCLFLYAVRPCILNVTNTLCGDDAAAAVTVFLNRIMNIHMCNPDDTIIFERLLSTLT